MRHGILWLAVLIAAMPVAARSQPLIRPARDVAVEYRSGAAGEAGNLVTMRFAGKGGRVRIDGAIGQGYAILDVDAGRMTVVMTDRQTYLERPAEPGMVAMFQAGGAAFKKTGTDTVAGVACTTYDATINNRDGKVCITGDGVLLRARSDDPDRQRQLEAVKVTYAEQAAALFQPPPGFRKMDLAETPGRRPPSGVGAPDAPRDGTPAGR